MCRIRQAVTLVTGQGEDLLRDRDHGIAALDGMPLLLAPSQGVMSTTYPVLISGFARAHQIVDVMYDGDRPAEKFDAQLRERIGRIVGVDEVDVVPGDDLSQGGAWIVAERKPVLETLVAVSIELRERAPGVREGEPDIGMPCA